MNRRRVFALVRKDWLELAGNAQAVAPLVVVPVLFAVVLPALILIFGSSPVLLSSTNGMDTFLETFPASLLPPGLTDSEAMVYALIAYFMAPFFLLIPVMVASVVASSSFAGEKERHTFEGLMYTPLTNRELVLGKVLASAVPAVLLTWASFACYLVLVKTLGGHFLDDTFPNATWLVLVFLVSPLIGFLTTCLPPPSRHAQRRCREHRTWPSSSSSRSWQSSSRRQRGCSSSMWDGC